jgi:hypothetical protein
MKVNTVLGLSGLFDYEIIRKKATFLPIFWEFHNRLGKIVGAKMGIESPGDLFKKVWAGRTWPHVKAPGYCLTN